MRTVGIKVLKNNLSEYVRLAANGEIVQVTDRNRVVAHLVPPPGRAASSDPDAWWAEEIRKGRITPATNPGGAPPRGIAVMTLEELLKDLDEARADRWE